MKYCRIQKALNGYYILRSLLRTKVTNYSYINAKREWNNERDGIQSLYKKASLYANKICVKDSSAEYTYSLLHNNAARLSRQISNICGSGSCSTVAFFCSNDILAILILWASWMSGQKTLALKSGLSVQELCDLIKGTKVSLIISSDLYEKQSKNLAFKTQIPLIHIDKKFLQPNFKAETHIEEPETVFKSEAFIAYNKENISKTLLITREELDERLKSAAKSWKVSENDKILYLCPSFHAHGDEHILNLLCPLSVGSQLNLVDPFDSKTAWQTILGINASPRERVSALIAEPDVYEQLILEYNRLFARDQRVEGYIKNYCLHNIRFMLSCFYRSSPTVSSNWSKITGHRLIETNFLNIKVYSGNKSIISRSNRFRITNSKNNVLLESNKIETANLKNLQPTIIGRLMISNQDGKFYHTGEIVSYRRGVLKTIGRCL